jgi:hypothetical protein
MFDCVHMLAASRTGARAYKLHLNMDYNTLGHTQWFFFGVSRLDGNICQTRLGWGGDGSSCQLEGGGASKKWCAGGRTSDGGEGAGENETDDEFVLTIVNMNKMDSLYNYGLLPLVYSMLEDKEEGRGWQRKGKDVRYYKHTTSCKRPKCGFALRFTLAIRRGDTCYVAHCYPYTYSNLQV